MSDVFARIATALADRYRLERELGAGGMATVYLAHDIKHDRRVAIKVLRPELAAVIGAERFLSEIKTTANLQHPHILPLFDSGEAESFLFYVMPYVEGETLRERITREHQLPVAESVRLATEIAGALDYAHRRGVIHRDIKPENVMLHDGQALVADFGIALAMAKTAGTRMTETGMSLGTPHYMSPEQAMGEREITGRSDVYALGAITYEMLVGEPPFTGPTAQAIIARVMTEEPRSLTAQRKSIPHGVEAAVFTALEKLPADRYATAAEFAAALRNEGTTSRRTTPMVPARRAGRMRWVAPAAVGVAALAAGLALGRRLVPAASGDPGVIRATLELGDSATVRPIGNVRLAISPSGKRIVFVGNAGAESALWVREIGQPAARMLADTRGAFAPFFSPDGESVGFFTLSGGGTAMKVVPVAGGVARTVVADSVSPYGGADWGDDGNIYFVAANRGLARVTAAGDDRTLLAHPDSAHGIRELDFPDVLPGSRLAFVMLWKGSIGSNRIGVVDLRTGTVTVVAEGSYPRYAAPGYLAVGAANGRVLVSRFDIRTGRVVGAPVLALQDVQDELSNGTLQFAVSATGTFIYQQKDAGAGGQSLVWVDRAGHSTPADTSLRGIFSGVALSPDGGQIALAVSGAAGSELWVKQLATGGYSRLAGDLTDADRPSWAPDGRTLGYLGGRNGQRTAWLQRADGSDAPHAATRPDLAYDEIWFDRTGRYTLFRSEGSGQGTRHIMVQERGVDTVPRPLVTTRNDNFAMALSPDGRWLAYVSDESGSKEVYVRPFPNVDSARFAISAGGGLEPLWSRLGTELFYRSPRGDMMTAAVTPGATFQHGAPHELFAATGMLLQEFYRSYDVTPDGQRFLMLNAGGSATSKLSVIFNWRPEVVR